jgi:hypothetical protein
MSIAVGLVASGLTFGIGQLAFVPWTWLRLLIILLYVAPATVLVIARRTESSR